MSLKKKSILIEDHLDIIIKKVLKEQSVIGAPNYGNPLPGPTEERIKIEKQYHCVPYIYQPFVDDLIKKGYNRKFLKVALGIIGRESDYGQSARYRAKQFATLIGDILNSKKIKSQLSSKGLAQMKYDTAKRFNVDPNTVEGALVGAYRYALFNYKLAKSQGYDSSKPSSNYDKGTGDGALDIAIVGYNQGESFIHKYCETSDPKKKSDCKNAGKTVKLKYGPTVKVTNKEVKNYLPYYKSKNPKHFTGLLTSWGYVKEVANRMRSFNCF